MVSVTVYTKSNCPGCITTLSALKRKNIPHETVSLDDNPEAVEVVKSKGYRGAPVVQAGEKWWQGFSLANINAIPAL